MLPILVRVLIIVSHFATGSQQDLAARVKAAQTEAEWKGAGDKEGIQIWRIEKYLWHFWITNF